MPVHYREVSPVASAAAVNDRALALLLYSGRQAGLYICAKLVLYYFFSRLNNGLRMEMYPGARRLKVSRNSEPLILSSPRLVWNTTESVYPSVLYVTFTLEMLVYAPPSALARSRISDIEKGLPEAPATPQLPMVTGSTRLASLPPCFRTTQAFRISANSSWFSQG